MATKPLFGTVVYLTATGHVLAVVTCGALEPTIEELTGGDCIRVRVPNETAYVNVPPALLSVKRVEVTQDVLDRPQWYVFNDGAVPLSLELEPQYDQALPAGGGAAASGKKLVVIWQTPTETIPDDSALDAAGNLPAPATTPPPGATAQLAAWEGGALYVQPIP
jgi:hypothetical protein